MEKFKVSSKFFSSNKISKTLQEKDNINCSRVSKLIIDGWGTADTISTKEVQSAENKFLTGAESQLQDIICTLLCSAPASVLTGFLGLW